MTHCWDIRIPETQKYSCLKGNGGKCLWSCGCGLMMNCKLIRRKYHWPPKHKNVLFVRMKCLFRYLNAMVICYFAIFHSPTLQWSLPSLPPLSLYKTTAWQEDTVLLKKIKLLTRPNKQTINIVVTSTSWSAFDLHQRALLPSLLLYQHGLHFPEGGRGFICFYL